MISVAAVQAAPWRFIVWCDTRSDSAAGNPLYSPTAVSPYTANVAAAVSRESADFVLCPGDLAYGDGRGAFNPTHFRDMFIYWDNWLASAAPILNKFPVYLTRGNNEAALDNAAGQETQTWKDWITSRAVSTTAGIQAVAANLNYTFTHKNCVFIGLDEYAAWASDSDKNTTTVNLPFLNNALSAAADHRFVFLHQPVWYGDPLPVGPNTPVTGPQDFANAMNGKVDLIFTGHVHIYNREGKPGYSFQEIIAGDGGAPLDKYKPPTDPGIHSVADAIHFGYVLVTVDGARVTTEFKYLLDPSSSTSAVAVGDRWPVTLSPELLLLRD
ncbi:MAG: metallophosphoesterase family protein [Desulfobaccales bacterium]